MSQITPAMAKRMNRTTRNGDILTDMARRLVARSIAEDDYTTQRVILPPMATPIGRWVNVAGYKRMCAQAVKTIHAQDSIAGVKCWVVRTPTKNTLHILVQQPEKTT